jgi:hypothetical protein
VQCERILTLLKYAQYNNKNQSMKMMKWKSCMKQLKKFSKIEKVSNNIIMGDWNSVVGDETYRNIVGSHGLGRC